MRVLEPEGWMSPRGYANGVVATGRLVVLAGQIGWNPVTATFDDDDLLGQVRRTLENVATLLREAGGEPQHLVRMTWYITDRDAYLAARRPIGHHYRELFGAHYPPMSIIVVSGLIEPRALVEIEATAVLPG